MDSFQYWAFHIKWWLHYRLVTACKHTSSMLSLDRGGLGRDMLLKRQREVKEALKHETAKKRVKIEQNQRDSFRRHMSGKFAERQTSSDLYKSQKACEQLDKSKVNPCSFTSNNLFLTIVLRPSQPQTQLWSPVHLPLWHEESTQIMWDQAYHLSKNFTLHCCHRIYLVLKIGFGQK